MSTKVLTPEILYGGETSARKFDPKSATPFVNKSISDATRRAYGRALREFFQSAGMKHPLEVVPQDVLLWRDKMRSQRKSAATVAFKLSVVRSFFEYLKAAGAVSLNPASTKLVSAAGTAVGAFGAGAIGERGAIPALGAGPGEG